MGDFRKSRCPICGSHRALSKRSTVAETRIFHCPDCGAYEISGAALYEVVALPHNQRAEWLEKAKEQLATKASLPLVTLDEIPDDARSSFLATFRKDELASTLSAKIKPRKFNGVASRSR